MTQEPIKKISLQVFKTISHAISTYDDFPLMIDHFIEAITRAFNVKGCSILLLDEAEQQLFHLKSYGVSEEYVNKGSIFINKKYSSFVTGEPVYVENLQNDSRIQYPEVAAKEGFVSLRSFPIKCKKSIIGMIRLYHSDACEMHKDDIDSFCILAEHLGLAIEINGLKNFVDLIKTSVNRLPNRMLEI